MPTKKRRTMRRNKMVRRTKTRNKRYRGGNDMLARRGANLISELKTIEDRYREGVINESVAEEQKNKVNNELQQIKSKVKAMDFFGEGVLPTGKSMYRTG